ncbi:hypothetical protein F5Y16DRAFT_264370 [Xylariaceae sp. FL0255]|nr:hypothetical protein F5Y16DRAFT_264370 [Xylariaceae sp. FL0255]
MVLKKSFEMNINRRSTQWGLRNTIGELAGLLTAIFSPMTSEQAETYAILVRIIESTHNIDWMGDAIQTDLPHRPPSPSQQYDELGRRTNTRHQRHEKCSEERHALVQVILSPMPSYRAPPNYRPRTTLHSVKIYVAVKEFKEENFIGQIFGPHGRSLAELNTQSGANIVIRGRGSTR